MPGTVRYLHHFFEQEADVRPNALALLGMKHAFTYREVDTYTNQIAHYIRENGVISGDMIGLFFNRSELPILAMLGILKAGAGYVPIDPAYPEDRVQHILADASIKMILSETDLESQRCSDFSGETIPLDKVSVEIKKQPSNRINPEDIGLKDSHLSYIIYTSGSTGKPKGVMTEHGNIVSFVHSFKKVCAMTPQDRVYQGFSFGFDGSVEEIWMAYANGAVLITGNNDMSKFASETAQYLTEQKVSYFSTVPTFLSMIKEELPTVKILVVSGEACPQELVDKWAHKDRRMLNVYGPTEATVNTTAAECRSGKSVTIGKPLDGYDTFILDDKLQPVEEGALGELYIGGPGLCRGYMNLPQMTENAFIPRPDHIKTTSSRIYKTGDLVSLTQNKELNFFGRIDSQVKIRGYRIELSEIEAVLREHPLVHASAVKPFQHNGMTELAAFIVLNDGVTEINKDEIIEILKKKLPIYMVPSHLDIIDTMPTLTSGKTDRKRLPEALTPLIKINRIIVEPQTATEIELSKIWNEIFKLPAISVEDDFFMDLGGYSLVAAQVVSVLRKQRSNSIAIRDIYQYSTIKKLGGYLDSIHLEAASVQGIPQKTEPVQTSSQVFSKVPPITRLSCVGLQALSIGLFSGFTTGLIYLSVLFYNAILNGTISHEWIAAISITLFLGAYPTSLLIAILSKWLVIGNFKPGQYPLYSIYYFRWWFVTRIQRITGATFLAGTPLVNFYYRLMGAKVGRNCVINTTSCSIFDCVKIGDNTSIGFETQLPGYKVENGMLIIGTIEIGNNCFVGIQSSIGLNTSMANDTSLDDLSFLPDGETILQGEGRRGSPAQKAEVKVPDISGKKQLKGNTFFFGLSTALSFYFIELFIIIAALPSVGVFYLAFQKEDWLWWISMLIVAIPLFEITFWVMLILVKHLIIGKTKPGIFPVNSISYLRKWTIDSLINLSRLITLPLYTTLYIIPLLRLLGIKIGSRAELSVISYLSPDITEIGSEGFFADGSIIGGLRFYKGYCEIAENKIGKRSFIGNSAVLPTGKSVGDNCLIAVLSTSPENTQVTPDGTEWLGCPSFKLPHRKKVEGFGEGVIFKPSKKLFVARLFIDGLRIAIPSTIEIASLVSLILLVNIVYKNVSGPALALYLPLIGIGILFCTLLSVIMVKNILIGVYKPVIKPLWSPYVWINEVVNGVYESVAAPILTPLLGTPFLAYILRLFGVKVGKNVFIETALFGEFDLVEIGDFAALNVDVIVQNHLFEDRIFKSSYLKIGKDCSVGNMAVILYDTEMQEGSSISSLSLLMKGETIPSHSQWEGIPIKNITGNGKS
jgi:non-ribosomal peptide synthetase-like protein